MTVPISKTQQRICDKFGLPAQAPEPMVALAIGSLDQSPIYGTRIVLPELSTSCTRPDRTSAFTS